MSKRFVAISNSNQYIIRMLQNGLRTHVITDSNGILLEQICGNSNFPRRYNVAKVKPHVIIECLPCESFSVAGTQRVIKDPLGKHYRDNLNHVTLLQPEIVAMVNVYVLALV